MDIYGYVLCMYNNKCIYYTYHVCNNVMYGERTNDIVRSMIDSPLA